MGSLLPTDDLTWLEASVAACWVVLLIVLPALFTAPHVLFKELSNNRLFAGEVLLGFGGLSKKVISHSFNHEIIKETNRLECLGHGARIVSGSSELNKQILFIL